MPVCVIHMDTAWECSRVSAILSLDRFLSFPENDSDVFLPRQRGPVTGCCWSDTLDVVQRFKRPRGWKGPFAGQTEGCFL